MNYPKVDKPTEPGLYWYRRQPDHTWSAVDVDRLPRGLVALMSGVEDFYLLDELPGEWCGPIPVPK